jgi:hypothetical protein
MLCFLLSSCAELEAKCSPKCFPVPVRVFRVAKYKDLAHKVRPGLLKNYRSDVMLDNFLRFLRPDSIEIHIRAAQSLCVYGGNVRLRWTRSTKNAQCATN